MISLQVDGIKELKSAIDGTRKNLPRELSIAINATAKKVSTGMSKQVRQHLVVKAGDVKKVLKVRKKAKANQLSAMVRLSKSKRISLRAFSARQIRAGVSYKINKQEGRKTVAGAFRGPRPGVIAPRLYGGVFKRTGTSRLPIVKLHGPSPGGVYVGQQMRPKTINDGSVELAKQIQRRVRFNLLKKQGLI